MKKKTILVTGNLGYIGSAMVPFLVEKGYDIIGYDVGYYEDCYLEPTTQKLVKQIKKDVRLSSWRTLHLKKQSFLFQSKACLGGIRGWSLSIHLS